MATAPRPGLWDRWLSDEGYLGVHLAGGFVLAVGAASGFFLLAHAVLSRADLLAADLEAQHWTRAVISPALTTFMVVVTELGTPYVLAALSITVIAWLLETHSRRRLVAFVATMAGGGLLNQVLKGIFQRPRPGTSLAFSDGWSFPSGHSMASMLFFGSLCYVVWFTPHLSRTVRGAALVTCISLAVIVGVSRVYLGVHYLTDVVGGYLAALCWMGICLSTTEGWVRLDTWRRRRPRD